MIGRDAEREEIGQAIARARAGHGGALLVTGGAGTGKSVLLDAALAEAEGVDLVRTVATEAEAAIAYAGLDALFRPLLASEPALASEPRSVIDAVLGLGPPRPADPLAVAGAALELLGAAADRRPLVLVVDDAQWLDPETTATLAFCALRLTHDPILLLAAGRSPLIESSPIAQVAPSLPVGTLPGDEARALLAGSGLDLAPDVADAILETAQGVPLAILQIPVALTSAQRNGSAPLPDPLPVGGELERLFAGRAAELAPGTRAALLVLAAGAGADSDLLGASVTAAALAEARAAGLIRQDSPEFVHPLMRSGVYGAAGPAERRAAHAALAEDLREYPAERALHLAAAQVEADEAVAAELEGVGMQAMSRLGLSSAVGLLSRAAELSVTGEARVARLTGAAQAAFMGGAFPVALELLGAALAARPEGLALARVEALRGEARMWLGPTSEAEAILSATARSVGGADPMISAPLMLKAAFTAGQLRGDIAAGERFAREALDLAEGGPLELQVVVTYVFDAIRALGGHQPFPPLATAQRVVELIRPTSPLAFWLIFASLQVVWGDQPAAAAALTARSASAHRRDGMAIAANALDAYEGAALIRGGRLARGASTVEAAGRVAEEAGQTPLASFALGWRAYAAACAGDDAALTLADRGSELARSVQIGSMEVFQMQARGLHLLVSGHPADAAAVLAPLQQVIWDECGMYNPAAVPFWGDLVEALAADGRPEEARRVLDRVDAQAADAHGETSRATWHRCHGLLAPSPDEVTEHLREAVRAAESGGAPLEAARARLQRARRLVEWDRRAEARRVCRDAHEQFTAMGAGGFARQTRALLDELDDRPARGPADPMDLLTSQERQVASMVGEGLSNPQVAERLFLTRRTVEFHLTNVYRKLGLRGRTALAAAMSRRPTASG